MRDAIIIGLAACGFVALADASWAASRDRVFYDAIQSSVKKEFDNAVAFLMEKKATDASQADLNDMLDMTSMLFYNKASIYVVCFLEVGDSQKGAVDRTKLEAEAGLCVDAHMVQLHTWITMVEDYGASLDPRMLTSCQMKARQFEREIELPPYEFLKTDSPWLFDFEVLNACVRQGS